MKKLTVLALGLGLMSGMAVFAQDKPADTKTATTEKKQKKQKKSKTTAAPADASKTAPATK